MARWMDPRSPSHLMASSMVALKSEATTLRAAKGTDYDYADSSHGQDSSRHLEKREKGFVKAAVAHRKD